VLTVRALHAASLVAVQPSEAHRSAGFEASVPFLNHPYQARVARYIGCEDRGEAALDAFRGQSGAPQPQAEEIIGSWSPF
jgi:hypothetical protein